MKLPNIAPAYVTLYPGMCEVAREMGYALALHGSMVTDMDCIAIAWEENACSPRKLVEQFRRYFKLMFPASEQTEEVRKPHGRIAVGFNLGDGAQVDLSIIPPTPPSD